MKVNLLATLSFIGLMFAITSCTQNPQKQAESLVKKQLETSLHDMNSYESVEFGTLDSAFSKVEDLEEYKEVVFWEEKYSRKCTSALNNAETYEELGLYDTQSSYIQEAETLLDSLKKYEKRHQELDSLFVPKFIGWKLEHTFRANNPEGHKVISHRVYYFDKDLTKIVRDEDNSKRESEE